MTRFIALSTTALYFALALYGDAKSEARLKSEVLDQAVTITSQSATIADLKSQLAAARIQSAVLSHQASAANGEAAGSGAEVVDLTSKLRVAQSETEHAKSVASGSTEKVADLQTKLADAHVQTAKAIGAASGTRAELKSRRAEDTAATVKGCKDSSLDVIAAMSVELSDLAKEQKGRSRNHSETMDKIDRQNTMTMRLLVLIAIFICLAAAVIAILFRARNSNA